MSAEFRMLILYYRFLSCGKEFDGDTTMKIFPIIPEEIQYISAATKGLIHSLCPLSTIQIVDDEDDPNDPHTDKIYTFVGIISIEDLNLYIPSQYKKRFGNHMFSLFENYRENGAIFWHEGVIRVMISNDQGQHWALMDYYDDISTLLTMGQNDQLIGSIRHFLRKVRNPECAIEFFEKIFVVPNLEQIYIPEDQEDKTGFS